MGRSTYDETFLGRTVTIDWDKSQCYDDGYMTKKDLNEDIAQLNDPTYNVYQGIVDLNVEGKGTEKYHLFKRGQVYSGRGEYNDYFTVDTMELRYTFFIERSSPSGYEGWFYFLPGFGY